MHSLHVMPQDSIHLDVLRDKIAAAQQRPTCCGWAAGISEQ